MQGMTKKNKEAECCNNCVYSPLTIFDNEELKGEKNNYCQLRRVI